jgi:hypothetical protein
MANIYKKNLGVKFDFFAFKMAPTGQETQQIRAIDDLDDVNTSGKTLKRNKSINNTAVLVAIKCVAEHDDLNPRETTNAEPDTNDKLQSETEDGKLRFLINFIKEYYLIITLIFGKESLY